MKCFFIRWDPDNSDFTFNDLENSFNAYYEKSTSKWKIPKSLDPKIGDSCFVSLVDKERGGYIAICGVIEKVETGDICEVQLNGYFADTDCYPLLYAYKFSKLTKTIDFDNGPEVELMDESIVIGFHLIILQELVRHDIIFLDQVEDLFNEEMTNILRAIKK